MRFRPLLPHAAFALLFSAVIVFAVTGEAAVRNAAQLTAVALMALQTVRHREGRAGWALLTLANAAWAGGDLDPANLNWLFMVSFAFAHAGLVLLVVAHARNRWQSWLALDGVVVALAAAAILTHFVSAALVGLGLRVPATALAGDAMLVTTVVLAFAVNGWRPARAWWVIAAGETILVTIDLTLVDAQQPGRIALVGWMTAHLLTSYAIFHPTAARGQQLSSTASAAVAAGGGAIATAVLMHAGLTSASALTIWLAGAALTAGLVRATALIAEHRRLLRDTRVQAVTDKLTGLPNRRALTDDLDRAVVSRREHTLAFFDLDGFKEYNDAFGHAAGDALLQRLAPALGGYRLGGDEFCALLPGALGEDAPEILRAVAALSEHGDGFTIGASFGLVVLPHEARSAAEALRLADERMYSRKRRRRAGQARDLLMQVLAERGETEDGVAARAAAVGRALGLSNEELDVLIRAAELRDVGMVAIPDGLGCEEPLYRQHPVVGERILAAAGSMRPVARIVRSTHERFDGTGYPDGLRGEEIPLAARIIAVCAAETLDAEGFDPRVVSAAATSSAGRAPAGACAGPWASARSSSPGS